MYVLVIVNYDDSTDFFVGFFIKASDNSQRSFPQMTKVSGGRFNVITPSEKTTQMSKGRPV